MTTYTGIDVGTNILGWALVADDGEWLDGGAVELKSKKRGFDSLLDRLQQVDSWCSKFDTLCDGEVIVGIEEPHFSRSRHTPIVLGMAFGIVVAAALRAGHGVWRCTPSQGKQALTDIGNASKADMLANALLQGMTYTGPGEQDAADAFGVALAARNAHILETLP